MRLTLSAQFPSLYAGWVWWCRELAACVPARLRRLFGAGRGRLVLALGPDERAELIHDSAKGETHLATLDLADADAARAALARHIRRAPIALRLPEEAALVSTLDLPLAAARNLDQVIAFELDRRTPFRREDVYLGHCVVRRDVAAKRLSVRLAVAPRETVDRALAAVARCGLAPDHAEVARTPAANLLPPRPPGLMRRVERTACGTLAVATVALALAAILVPLERAHRTEAALAAELAQARHQANESVRLENAIQAAIQESGFLARRRTATPSPSRLLDAVTRLLPDDTWLDELTIDDKSLHIDGFAGSAADVLTLIDRSPRFADATFRSPVTQDRETGRERFNITARIVRAAP